MNPSPTRARLTVLGLLCGLTFILYIDRVCISQAVVPIQQELGLSDTRMSYVLMAFTLAYGIFELPTGRLGDRLGARSILTRVAIWWSAFTALTAACPGFWSLLAVRFLFGAGEAGAYPNIARVIARWFPAGERGRVQGLIQATAFLGGSAAPVIAAYLIQATGWRGAFVVFGVLGAAWAGLFWWWFRDDPAAHPAVNPAECDLIHGGAAPASALTAGRTHAPIPWAAVARSRSIATLGLIMICASFNSYLYFSWFPKYLQDARGVGPVEAGWLASLVLAGASVGIVSGGFLTDRLPRHLRRWQGMAAYTLAAALIALGVSCESPRATAAFAALSCLSATSTLSSWWSGATEASGRHIGALFGLMNGLGVFGAMGSQFFFGAFADYRKSQGFTGRDQWDPAFGVTVAFLLLGGLAWSTLVVKPIEDPEAGGENAPT